jgi:hypothetical protein
VQNRSNRCRLGDGRRSAAAVLLAVAATLLIAVAPVAAQSPASAQYADDIQNVAGEVAGNGRSGPDDPGPSGLEKRLIGGLPFTGLDLVALVAVAIGLTSIGFALRKMTAHRGEIGQP